MLNIGLIGSVGSISNHVRNLKGVKGIRIIGKSSVGMMEQHEGASLTIPECNRRELVDAAGLLVVDRSSLLDYDLLKSAVKNSSHLYFTDFPDLSPDQCAELLKIAGEAQTVIKIKNPLLVEPLTGWVAANFQEPAYLSLFETLPAIPEKRELLTRHLYYALALFGTFPQKIRVTAIHQPPEESFFFNLRFDYPSSSIYNLEVAVRNDASRTLRAVMPGKFLEGNCISGRAHLNNREITLSSSAEKELASFVSLAGNEDFFLQSDMNAYCSTLSILREVLLKIKSYTSWQ
ncbi:MAG: hypothetical protein QM301_09360 [Bacteroidota bacterium]|jgi:hypothetical protein|nr:hypothetical protein [Prolixibacteraceae bacterium]MDI9564381.1 hypothetical protein [Bacteroidota bacterium]NLT00397.1 hypothetical protein [Bacteroidales bacterium]HNZ70113.1 hypothetical protein [Prolixibacteraceae bacterium]HOC87376.1 hypothetical protein [Prolixibacteraceae bacterium]